MMKMLILGHRGYHRDVQENTLAAFGRAVAIGLDGIETDVQVSADGVAILIHDRCAPDGTPISSLTHADLEGLVGYSVPRLEEAVTGWDKEILWNLELKTASSLEPTIALVNRYQSTKRFLVTSFLHPLVLDLVNRTAAEGGLLVAHRPLNDAALRDWTAGSKRVTTIVWDYDTCDGDLIARSAAKGFRNFVYGARTADDHQCLRKWVVDGAITDYPQYLRTGRGEGRRDDDYRAARAR
jgi:glycerophosphoryl diester phosphodiesterase